MATDQGGGPERKERRTATAAVTPASAAGTARCASAVPDSIREPAPAGPADDSTLARSGLRRAARRSAASAEARGRASGSGASAPSTAARSRRGRSGRSVRERRRARLDRHARPPGAGTPRTGAGRRAPPRAATPTDQTSLSGVASLAREPLGRDVRERAGHVADGGQRVGAVELGEAEVEEAYRRPRRDRSRSTFDGLTSRWTIPARCACARRVENLRADLHRVAVVDARRFGAPRERCGPERTRTRCRRGRRRGRSRTPARSARAGDGVAAWASRSARAAAFPSRGMILSATSRPVCSSRASQTEPEPPLPSGPDGPIAPEDELLVAEGDARPTDTVTALLAAAPANSSPASECRSWPSLQWRADRRP